MLNRNPQNATRGLGWTPKTTLEETCRMMAEAELARNSHEVSL
jgi:GDP-D-mannose dehydratase